MRYFADNSDYRKAVREQMDEPITREEADVILRENGIDPASLYPRFIERIRREHPELLATIGEE